MELSRSLYLHAKLSFFLLKLEAYHPNAHFGDIPRTATLDCHERSLLYDMEKELNSTFSS